MPDQKFERQAVRMNLVGIDLNNPVDAVKPGRLPVVENMRSYLLGVIEPRPSLDLIGAASGGSVHTIRRLNDSVNNDWNRFIGTGTKVDFGKTSFTNVATGFSGNPLCMVPARPQEANSPWMYIGDSAKTCKIDYGGTVHQIGMQSPVVPPTAEIGLPQSRAIDELTAVGSWANTGTAGALSQITRVNTTIVAVLYDTGTTGWASVYPLSMVGINPSCRILFSQLAPGTATDEVRVQDVLNREAATAPVEGSVTPADITIASVIYDSGTTGLCSVVLSTPLPQLERNSMIYLTGGAGAEYVRVLSVNPGPDGQSSIQFSSNLARAVGDVVTVVPSLRGYLNHTYAANDTITQTAIRSTVTTGAGAVSLAASQNMSIIWDGFPLLPDDFIHVSVRLSDPSLVSEGKIMFDVDLATNDFTKNFYYYAYRANDLTPNVTLGGGATPSTTGQTLITTRQTIIQKDQIDQPLTYADTQNQDPNQNPNGGGPEDGGSGGGGSFPTPGTGTSTATSGQTDTGASQWTEIKFRVSELIRVGTDNSVTLANVKAIRFALVTTGSVVFDLNALWIGGGFGPDISGVQQPYIYRYRGRSQKTGVRSNPSPPIRLGAGISAQRQPINVTIPNIPVTECTDIEIERFGGTLTEWRFVGSIANPVSTGLFVDTLPDSAITGNTMLGTGTENFQPWPIVKEPQRGYCDASGTTILDSGTNFNLQWAQGNTLLVNGVTCTLYRVISTSKLELYENVGNLTNVVWQLDSPLTVSQPLPIMWQSQYGNLFGLGDPANPGRLYFTRTDNVDATREEGWLDLCSPSEQLQAGCSYKGVDIVFSSERVFIIRPDFSNPGKFTSEISPNTFGLFSRWAFADGPELYYLTKDGINITTGGEPRSLTDETLYPLFPHEGIIGQTVNGFKAPAVTSANQPYMQLCYADDWIYFNYLDTDSAWRTLAYNNSATDLPKGWWPDVYQAEARVHYLEEGAGQKTILVGGNDGNVYQYVPSGGTESFLCHFRTKSEDQGDPRSLKLYADVMLDADTAGLTVTCHAGLDNYTNILLPASTVTTAYRQQAVFQWGNWQNGRNIALDCTFTGGSARPQFYIWEPRWTVETAPFATYAWETISTTYGLSGYGYTRSMYFAHNSTDVVTLQFTIDGVAMTPIVVPASGGIFTKYYIVLPAIDPALKKPWKGKYWKLRASSSAPFRCDAVSCEFLLKMWGDSGAYKVTLPWGTGDLQVSGVQG